MISRNCVNFIVFCVLGLLLCSCSYFTDKNSERSGKCREIEHRKMFDGDTHDQNKVWQARAEQGRLDQDYKTEGCG